VLTQEHVWAKPGAMYRPVAERWFFSLLVQVPRAKQTSLPRSPEINLEFAP